MVFIGVTNTKETVYTLILQKKGVLAVAKKTYRVRNWTEYNKSLVQRGSLTFWFSNEVIAAWEKGGDANAHGNQRYANAVILCALTLRQLFHLPLRNTAGLFQSLAQLMGLTLKAPNYSTLCRRAQTLSVHLPVSTTNGPRHVLVDATGVQVIGEGEWKRLRHGQSRCQVWRKLHIAMDADSQMILAATMTESVRLDANYLPGLIDAIDGPIDQITGVGAYDKKNCYQTAYERGAKPVFPPQHNAIVQRNNIKKDPALIPRDEAIGFMHQNHDRQEQRKQWKIINDYHRRSLVETAMSRMKTLFTDKMRDKSLPNQQTTLMLRCYAINKITNLGMPISVPC